MYDGIVGTERNRIIGVKNHAILVFQGVPSEQVLFM